MKKPRTENKARFKKEFKEEDMLEVISLFQNEVKSLTIQKKLIELLPSKYGKTDTREAVSKKWVTVGLSKLESAGKVEKIKHEDELADYWKLKND